MSKTHYILQGGPENLKYWKYQTERERTAQWFWSANKSITSGDIAFIYLTAPESRIVGEVDVIGEPFFHAAGSMFDNPHMADKWCVEVANPRYFGNVKEVCEECGKSRDGHSLTAAWHEAGACEAFKKADPPLSMKNLKKIFSVDWGWVRYPRGNTRVPDEILPALLELINTTKR